MNKFDLRKQYVVAIPEYFLLILAVGGNMGDGEIPSLMQEWARKEVKRLGFINQYVQMQVEHAGDLGKRLEKTLGLDVAKDIEKEIKKVISTMREKQIRDGKGEASR